VTLAAAVVSPHPPLLVPPVAAGAAAELSDLRAAASRALETMWAADPDVVIVVGAAPHTRAYGGTARGSFDGYGVPLRVSLDGGAGAPPPVGAPASDGGGVLPLSLAVGAFLLGSRPRTPPRRGQSVAAGATAADCAALGRALAASAARVGLLVMADGSACRGEKSPGYDDPRAEAFDAAVTSALRAGDAAALLDLDAALANQLLAAGRPAWQVLAGAAGTGGWRGEVGYDAAPYGVQYTVATWTPA
jgi:hypothetical protein